ncbi:MAG: META domain-containing protein [Hyphomonadaceae bacterium]
MDTSAPSGAWELEHLEGAPADAPRRPTMEFSGDGIAGSSGCNRFSARRQTDPNVAAYFREGIALTRMACPGPAMEMERLFIAALGRTADIRVENGLLRVFDAANQEIMRFRPAPAAS